MEEPTHSRNSQLLAALGGLFIIIGILALVAASWDSFTPLGRTLTVVMPLTLLYVLTLVAAKRKESYLISRYTLLTASVILPFVLGTIAYQSGLYTNVDASLVTVLALISAANAGAIEFLFGDKRHTPLTLISLLVAAGGLCSWFALDTASNSIVFFLTGALMMGLGKIQGLEPESNGSPVWHYVGTIVMLGSLLVLPPAFASSTASDPAIYTPLDYVVVAFILLILAVQYSRLWQAHKNWRFTYELRQLNEYGAAFILTVPSVIATLSSGEVWPFFILIGTSALSLWLSTHIRVNWFRGLGIAGGIIALLRLLIFGLQGIAAIWPIVLVTGGLLLIVIALFGAQRGLAWTQPLLAMPETSWEKLGEVAAPEPKEASTGHRGDVSNWLWFFLALILLYVLSNLH